uniref:MFS transporter n=1 Tax=Roseovarius dicentrarchi TaxID=2250573 RepID=UPI001939E3CC
GVFGGMAAGAWGWGALAESHGAGQAMLGAAALLVLGALAGLAVPLPDSTDLNLDPLDHFTEPPLRLNLRQRSGPIMILIDYDIAQDDVQEFLEVMHQRRRIRIRDGAQKWTLLRDLENPDVWTETYHVPTWVEYVRHHERRTQADKESYTRLIRLHRGPGAPVVHRMIERQAIPAYDDMPPKPPE